jgi:2-keto-3-deoxy-L-rhamnonate aldolase RhmA
MDTILITNDSRYAAVAEQAGVDRVMVDLEIIGKSERQRHLDTLISRHNLSDVSRLRSILKRTLLMVRVNPMHEHTQKEVDACIAAGADVLMLPMINHPEEVRRFIAIVSRRAKTCLLLETGAALARLCDIIRIPGIDEIHIGLNDLHLSLRLDFMFELLSGGIIGYMAQVIRDQDLRFGIGGVARLGHGLVSPELILSEYLRMGSSQVLLSRDYQQIFHEYDADLDSQIFRHEIEELHACVEKISQQGQQLQDVNSRKLKSAVAEIVDRRRGKLNRPTTHERTTA